MRSKFLEEIKEVNAILMEASYGRVRKAALDITDRIVEYMHDQIEDYFDGEVPEEYVDLLYKEISSELSRELKKMARDKK